AGVWDAGPLETELLVQADKLYPSGIGRRQDDFPTSPAKDTPINNCYDFDFLQYRRLRTAKREKKNQRPATSPDPARRASGHSRTYRRATKAAVPALPKMDLQRAAA